MAFDERFGFGMGLAIGIQAESVEGITDLAVTGVLVVQSNIDQHRVARIQLLIDGDFFELELNLHDETFIDRTITGKLKQKVDY